LFTPCQRKCKVVSGVCTGCSRTLDEIRGWRDMPNDARMKLMKELKWRGATHACPNCSGPAQCAMEEGKSGSLCWCMSEMPGENAMTKYDTCLCKNCLIGEENV